MQFFLTFPAMPSSELPAPRIYILFAREANKALILRRGPSKWTQLISWDLDSDTFEEGHWFKGRIYEKRSDLSPDGKYLVYFASKYHLGYENKGYKNTFTAISKPPYLTALALWPVGHTWYGGGFFESDLCVNLNISEWYQPHKDHLPHSKLEVRYQEDRHYYPEEDLFEITQRMNGWELVGESEFGMGVLEDEHWGNGAVRQEGAVEQNDDEDRLSGGGKVEEGDMEQNAELGKGNLKGKGLQRAVKKDSSGSFSILRSINFHRLPFDPSYRLFGHRRGKIWEIEGALEGIEFADWDGRGRLVLVRSGKVYCVDPVVLGNSIGFGEPGGFNLWEIDGLEPLLDLNGNRPRSFPPPDSAKVW